MYFLSLFLINLYTFRYLLHTYFVFSLFSLPYFLFIFLINMYSFHYLLQADYGFSWASFSYLPLLCFVLMYSFHNSLEADYVFSFLSSHPRLCTRSAMLIYSCFSSRVSLPTSRQNIGEDQRKGERERVLWASWK